MENNTEVRTLLCAFFLRRWAGSASPSSCPWAKDPFVACGSTSSRLAEHVTSPPT